MSLFEKKIGGFVVLPPEKDKLQPPSHIKGGRAITMTIFTIKTGDKQTISVSYMGELDGQVSVGDFVESYGFLRGPGVFRATQIWLTHRVDEDGELIQLDKPVRVANKCVCVVASLLYGRDSVEVQVLTKYRDQCLSRTRLGRSAINIYYLMAPWIVYELLMDMPRMQTLLKRTISFAVRILPDQL